MVASIFASQQPAFRGDTPTPPESPFADFSVDAGVSDFGDTGYYYTVYGSVTGQPLAGYPLLEFATRHVDYTQVAFTGNCVSTVTGWHPVIPGTTLGTVISDWAFVGEYTSKTWESTGQMTEGQVYAITWEQDT